VQRGGCVKGCADPFPEFLQLNVDTTPQTWWESSYNQKLQNHRASGSLRQALSVNPVTRDKGLSILRQESPLDDDRKGKTIIQGGETEASTP